MLVLGATAIDQDTMNELTRLYGFKKNDFRFETDYTKIVSFASRISDNSPAIYDARNHAGQLKVTKESFNAAILSMCSELLKRAC